MPSTKQVNLRIPINIIEKYQDMADSADDRDRSYFMKKALISFVEDSKPKKIAQKKSTRFIPPTVQEVRDYCFQRGNGIDPETFVSHYAGSGWKRGNTPIKDWKACVVTWEKRNKERANNGKQSLSQRSTSATERALQEIEMGSDLLGSDDPSLRLQVDV